MSPYNPQTYIYLYSLWIETIGVIGPIVYIYMYILGQRPNPRTRSSPRTGKHYHRVRVSE